MSSLDEGIFTLETGLPLSTGVGDLEKNNPAPAGGYSPKRIYDSDKLGVPHSVHSVEPSHVIVSFLK